MQLLLCFTHTQLLFKNVSNKWFALAYPRVRIKSRLDVWPTAAKLEAFYLLAAPWGAPNISSRLSERARPCCGAFTIMATAFAVPKISEQTNEDI
jgi:hypothetical protein